MQRRRTRLKHIIRKGIKITAVILLGLCLCIGAFATLFAVSMFSTSQYEIENMKITQQGTKLHGTWDDAGAAGYRIFVFRDRWIPHVYDTERAGCDIELASLGCEYKIIITAKNEHEGISAGKTATLKTHKLRAKISVEKAACEGIEGRTNDLNTTAPGYVRYKVSDKRIVSVERGHRIVYQKEGRADIDIYMHATPQYLAAKKRISVTVYPKQLQTPQLKVRYDGAQTAKLTWSEVRYAKRYTLYRKDPVTGSYQKLGTFKKGDTSARFPRINGRYRLKASATLAGEKITSRRSETASIRSPAASAKTYSSYHRLGTLGTSNMEVVTKISGAYGATVPQSFSLAGDNYVVTFVDLAGKRGSFCAYSRGGAYLGSERISDMGHANGSTYNPNTGLVYTVRTHRHIRSPRCTAYDFGNGFKRSSFDLPRDSSGIAYDETSNRFYLARGGDLYVTDDAFNVKKEFRKKIRYHHAQDIGGYNGVILVCTWVAGNESYLDLYRAKDGEYIGGYSLPFGEIESAFIDVIDGKKYLVILMNNGVGVGDCIMRTKEPIDCI